MAFRARSGDGTGMPQQNAANGAEISAYGEPMNFKTEKRYHISVFVPSAGTRCRGVLYTLRLCEKIASRLRCARYALRMLCALRTLAGRRTLIDRSWRLIYTWETKPLLCMPLRACARFAGGCRGITGRAYPDAPGGCCYACFDP